MHLHTRNILLTRLWAWCRIPDDMSKCWIWKGHTVRGGYGRLTVYGRGVMAHRLHWQLVIGDIPDGLNVLHHCDTPPCINIDHLFLGTDADNQADKTRKGRQVKGEIHWNAKLSNEQREYVVRTYRKTSRGSYRGMAFELGQEMGVTPACIRRIVREARKRRAEKCT